MNARYPNQLKLNKIDLKSDLVYELITQGRGLQSQYGFVGWPKINSSDQVTYGVTTWLAMRSLGLERFPWFPDPRFTRRLLGNELKVFKKLISDWVKVPSKFHEASDDILRIYEHTQSEFARLNITSVSLTRTFSNGWGNEPSSEHPGFASRLLTLQKAAVKANRKSFDIPFRILSSWGSGGYGQGGADISMDIPVKDIAWGNLTIADRTGMMHHAIEDGEWIVINRSMNGVVSIPTNAVTSKHIDPLTIQSFGTISEAEEYLDEQSAMFELENPIHLPGDYRRESSMRFSFRIRRAIAILIHGR